MTSHDSPDLNESVRVVLVTAPPQEVGVIVAEAKDAARLQAHKPCALCDVRVD